MNWQNNLASTKVNFLGSINKIFECLLRVESGHSLFIVGGLFFFLNSYGSSNSPVQILNLAILAW